MAVLAVLVPILTPGVALASTHHHKRRSANAHAASGGGWVCTLVGGGIVAGGILVTGGNPGGAVLASLAAGSFTAGCELGQTSNPTYYSGLPNSGSCYWEFIPGIKDVRPASKQKICPLTM
jgi:hypothetical protein